MSHASAGELRRLIDDPWAVPEVARSHVRSCAHCGRRQHRMVEDAEFVSGHLPDLDQQRVSADELALARVKRRAESGDRPVVGRPPRGRRITRRTAALGAGVVVLVAGTSAAAGELVTVLTPTKVAPVSIDSGDLYSLLRAFPTATLTQSATGSAYGVAGVRAAQRATGLPINLPSQLPAGVAAKPAISVQPRVTASLTFGRTGAGRSVGHGAPPGWLVGTTLHVQAGPAVLATYSSRSGPRGVPGLVVGYLAAPVLSATGATPQRIESYVLSRPGVSPTLAAEMRVLGVPGAVLPIPVPAGATVRHVRVDGAPAVVLSDASGFVSGVIWEQAHLVRVVGGLVSPAEAIRVADELG